MSASYRSSKRKPAAKSRSIRRSISRPTSAANRRWRLRKKRPAAARSLIRVCSSLPAMMKAAVSAAIACQLSATR